MIAKNKLKVVLVVGHSEKSYGAYNIKHNMTEYAHNKALAQLIHKVFTDSYSNPEINEKYKMVVMYRENGLDKLPKEINQQNPDLIVSLHANAYNKTVSGSEVLYYHKSKMGKYIAGLFQDAQLDALALKDRGLKPCDSEDRGGYLLRYTKAPCVILEPFFIDNDGDFEAYIQFKNNLVNNYGIAIANSLNEISKINK